jgi:hypothetical protein
MTSHKRTHSSVYALSHLLDRWFFGPVLFYLGEEHATVSLSPLPLDCVIEFIGRVSNDRKQHYGLQICNKVSKESFLVWCGFPSMSTLNAGDLP